MIIQRLLELIQEAGLTPDDEIFVCFRGNYKEFYSVNQMGNFSPFMNCGNNAEALNTNILFLTIDPQEELDVMNKGDYDGWQDKLKKWDEIIQKRNTK